MTHSFNARSTLGAVLDALPDPVYIVDARGRYVDALGTGAAPDVVGRNLQDLLPKTVAEDLLATLQTALDRKAVQVIEYRLPPETDEAVSDGEARWFEVRIAPVATDGKSEPCVAMLTTETTGRARDDDGPRASLIDPLTEVGNQRHFMNALEHEVMRQTRYREPFCLLLLELDHYDTIRERYGDEAGDAALRELARLIRQELRHSDILGRIEDAEFGVLLVNTPLKWGLEVGERIRMRTARTPFSLPRKTVQLTVSGGVAEFNNEDTSSSLLWRAEEALFKSGAKSENRISIG